MNLRSRVREKALAGRTIYICDDFVDEHMLGDVAFMLRDLRYTRAETSREGAPVSGSSADVPDSVLQEHGLFKILRALKERFFPGEPSHCERVYVNLTVYGDMYYPHRDCRPDASDVTVLYYANPIWSKDWSGETIFFNEDDDAELVISPRPGRIIVFPGALIHRGGVPSRICYQERLTLAYKFSTGERITTSGASGPG